MIYEQESRAVARKPRDAAAVLFSLKFVDVIHYKFNISQASKVRLQSSKHTGVKLNLAQIISNTNNIDTGSAASDRSFVDGPMGSLYSLVSGHALIH